MRGRRQTHAEPQPSARPSGGCRQTLRKKVYSIIIYVPFQVFHCGVLFLTTVWGYEILRMCCFTTCTFLFLFPFTPLPFPLTKVAYFAQVQLSDDLSHMTYLESREDGGAGLPSGDCWKPPPGSGNTKQVRQ